VPSLQRRRAAGIGAWFGRVAPGLGARGARHTAKVGAIACIAMAVGLPLSSSTASAKATFESTYGFERTWNAALRLVRVDMGLKVTEKDESTGYLLFDYRSGESGAKPTAGSLEFIRPPEPTDPVRVVVQLPSMPRYHEQVFVDSLARKLRVEYGEPPAKARPIATPRDAGAEAAPAE
jgi:hypothetical protein